MTALALAALTALADGPVTLSEEARDFLDRLSAQGCGGIAMIPLELELLEPCTLAVYPRPDAPSGFYMGMGGPRTLDLTITLLGPGWRLADSLPDDFPVLELQAPLAGSVRWVVACATDMTHNATTDSAVVMYALASVDPAAGPDDVPEDQDTTGVR